MDIFRHCIRAMVAPISDVGVSLSELPRLAQNPDSFILSVRNNVQTA